MAGWHRSSGHPKQRILATPVDPNHLLGHRGHPCCWGLEALAYLYFACWFDNRSNTTQFSRGNPYFFSENPYQSVSVIYASMYRENVYAIHIAMHFAKKIETLCNTNRQPAAIKEPKSELYFTWRDSRIRSTPLIDYSSIVLHGIRNLPLFGNLAEKASCVDDKNKTVLFRYTYS